MHGFGDLLWSLLTDMEPWLLVLICLYCGAWVVQFLDRLMQVALFGWIRLLWRPVAPGLQAAGCVFPGCGMRVKARYQLCHNHFLAASRYEWEHRDGWGKKDRQSGAFYVYLLELDGDERLYAGQTRNLLRRMQEHLDGTTKDDGQPQAGPGLVRADAVEAGGSREGSRPEAPDRHAAGGESGT